MRINSSLWKLMLAESSTPMDSLKLSLKETLNFSFRNKLLSVVSQNLLLVLTESMNKVQYHKLISRNLLKLRRKMLLGKLISFILMDGKPEKNNNFLKQLISIVKQ